MRGEDRRTFGDRRHVKGSPPHARGRLISVSTFRMLEGITPACAGKTCCRRRANGCRKDHPRMRGEDGPPHRFMYVQHGSPPHARGRRRVFSCGDNAQRITPACAGKTASRDPLYVIFGDHPRMRGEDQFVPKQVWIRQGSPPHARGRLVPILSGIVCGRITPACAGKTVYAEHARQQRGSPPHARGRLSTRSI